MAKCEGSGATKVSTIQMVLCCCGQRIKTENGKVVDHERTGPIVNGSKD